MDARHAMSNPTHTARPAGLDGLLAHIARRIEQIEAASTHAGHDSPTATPPSEPHGRKER